MEHRANLLWIPPDSDYNIKEVSEAAASTHCFSFYFTQIFGHYFTQKFGLYFTQIFGHYFTQIFGHYFTKITGHAIILVLHTSYFIRIIFLYT